MQLEPHRHAVVRLGGVLLLVEQAQVETLAVMM
jgi:hypothetical protein